MVNLCVNLSSPAIKVKTVDADDDVRVDDILDDKKTDISLSNSLFIDEKGKKG